MLIAVYNHKGGVGKSLKIVMLRFHKSLMNYGSILE